MVAAGGGHVFNIGSIAGTEAYETRGLLRLKRRITRHFAVHARLLSVE